jgi:hypothetical protein
MKLYYFVSCTLATGSLLIFPELRTPEVSEIRRTQIIRVEQLTYDASVITYLDASKAALLVYVQVEPGVGEYMGVQSSKILWLIRPKAKVGSRFALTIGNTFLVTNVLDLTEGRAGIDVSPAVRD